ncbi:MAG TPA: methylated-DNA--[protein]-cysteine S-methyltransferase [Acidocella sp.]|jgi:methylated-DNA-[protein]-cysteine S-methyltransferase|nr:methylated-DNA--[protein]-cysteine S-methyltransferase [Acidocella sp.]
MNDLYLDQMDTPIGPALLVTDAEGAVRALDFADYEPRMTRLLRLHYGKATPRPGAAPASVKDRLTRYFTGELDALDNIRCATGGTEFQRRVWAALRTIKPGTTLSYGRLAAQLGHPLASRAVGLANGANPISIIVPCHRVIGANGTLTGYGGGLPRKQWLLAHEGGADRLV